MDPNIYNELAAFLVDTRLEDIPSHVREDGRRSLLDSIACQVGGSLSSSFRTLADRTADVGRSPILGMGQRTRETRSALLGGISATWFDLDSGHRHTNADPPIPGGHPPSHIVPVLLARGEPAGISGADFFRIFLVAYEVGARLGIATQLRSGLHPHGVQATVASAATAALVAGGDQRRVERAMRVGAGLNLMPTMRTALDGGTVRNTFAGIGAMNGLLADKLAISGVEPERDPFKTVFRSVASTGFDPTVMLADLRQHWETTLGFYKVHACCRWNHPALDALEEMVGDGPIALGAVLGIDVTTFAFAAQMNNREPSTDLGAKFSIPFAVASFLVLGMTGYKAYSPDAIADNRVRAVAQRVNVYEDPSYSAALPQRHPTTVAVHFRDGSTRSATVQGSRGDPGNRFPPERMDSKFLELTGDAVGAQVAELTLEMLHDIEHLSDIRPLVANLTPGAH